MLLNISLSKVLSGSQLLGSMDDLKCPCCLSSDIWAFKNIDTTILQLLCNHCGFGIQYYDIKVIRKFWKDLFEFNN